MVATPFSELVGLEVELLLLSCFSSNVLGVTSKKNISVILLESEKKRILPRLSELQIRSLSSRTVNAMRAGKGPVNFLNVSKVSGDRPLIYQYLPSLLQPKGMEKYDAE